MFANVWSGAVRHGKAWCGKTSFVVRVRSGETRTVLVASGVAMRGVVMLGHVRYGMASLCGMIRVRYAGSWHVQAGCL